MVDHLVGFAPRKREAARVVQDVLLAEGVLAAGQQRGCRESRLDLQVLDDPDRHTDVGVGEARCRPAAKEGTLAVLVFMAVCQPSRLPFRSGLSRKLPWQESEGPRLGGPGRRA